jgi:hypothetical protein
VLTRSASGDEENATAVAGPPSGRGEDASGDRGAQQGLGWVNEAGYADERGRQVGVLRGGGVEAADVAPEQSLTR